MIAVMNERVLQTSLFAIATTLLLGPVGACKSDYTARPKKRASRVVVYSDEGIVIARVTDTDVASAIQSRLDAAVRLRGFVWDQDRHLANVSIFYSDGSEKRSLLFSDGVLHFIGEGPRVSHKFNAMAFIREIVQKYGCPLLEDIAFAGGSFSVFAEVGEEGGKCASRAALVVVDGEKRCTEVALELPNPGSLEARGTADRDRVWITDPAAGRTLAFFTKTRGATAPGSTVTPEWAAPGSGTLLARVDIGG